VSVRATSRSTAFRAILVVDCGSKKVDSIERAVFRGGLEPQVVRMNELKSIHLTRHRGIIISGSPILLTEANIYAYVELFNFTRSGNCPIMGICFGHQAIGLVYGAQAFRGPECRTRQTVQVVQADRLFDGLDSTFYVDEDHCEGITLPDQFILLARSGSYEVEAMKHRDKDTYGVQFHPETSGEPGRKIMGNFLKLCSSQATPAASRSPNGHTSSS